MKFKVACLISLGTLVLAAGCGAQSSKQGDDAAQDRAVISPELETYSMAYFASGCFWCVEAIFESVRGVQEAVSGYAGGDEPNPTYSEVSRGRTDHAEAVQVFYDSSIVDFPTLVEVYYGSHDPTTINGQHPDYGRQYRSILFYQNAEEKRIAQEFKRSLDTSGKYSKPIATEIVRLNTFWPAEEYHQDYEEKHPNEPYIRRVSTPRLNRFKAKFPELLKDTHE